MTAPEGYLRLEAVGRWREAPDAEPREVVVSIGKTTLLLTDLAERPLGHWALAGVRVLGEDETGATVYAMSAGETLTIGDRDMVAAIAAVRRRLPEPSKRRTPRLPLAPILAAAALVAAAAIAPRAIRAAAVRLVPPEQAAEIGDRMLIALIERHGPPCAEPAGERALARLARQVDPANPPRLRVMDLERPVAVALPGGTVVIDRTVLAAADGPAAISGQVAQAVAADPVAELVREAGLLANVRYVFTGRFGERTLGPAAESLLSAAPADAPPGPARLDESEWEALGGICAPR